MTALVTLDDARGSSQETIIRAGFLARFSDPTRSHYRMVIDQWYAWCHANGLSPVDAKRPHIEIWLRWLEEERGLMASTVSGKLTAVRGLYKYAQMDELIPANPCQWVRSPSVPQESTTKWLTRAELLTVLDLSKASDPQDHAILCVLGYNGLRVGELCSLTVECVSRKGGYNVLTFKREKSVKTARVPLMPRTSHALDLTLHGRTTGPLFLLRNEKPMDRRGVARIIDRIVAQAGITKRITPHSFRHTFITQSLHAGAALRDVSKSVGHKDARATARYDHGEESLARNSANWLAPYIEGAAD
jgi:integrase/recombinase XerD